jgi:hypothetical protein
VRVKRDDGPVDRDAQQCLLGEHGRRTATRGKEEKTNGQPTGETFAQHEQIPL